jgi:predicted acylesterase/phospholipase RssA
MTTALPLLFPAFSYMGSVYADGGLADDFPLSQIDPDATEGVAVGLRVVDHNTSATSRSPVPSSSTSLLDYMNCIFSVFLENIHELSLRLYRDRCAQIFTLSVPPEVPVYRFYLSNTDKFNMFSTGYESVRLQLGRGGSGTNESIIR